VLKEGSANSAAQGKLPMQGIQEEGSKDLPSGCAPLAERA
jgi:hypothetical protein